MSFNSLNRVQSISQFAEHKQERLADTVDCSLLIAVSGGGFERILLAIETGAMRKTATRHFSASLRQWRIYTLIYWKIKQTLMFLRIV
ncbi:MAG: hypothetical protein CMN55_09365 [Sneathiella sp.]|nr:hypothetical protein [Sneathiella sp.]